MPRVVRDSDEDAEIKTSVRRTRAAAAASITDSPVRRTTRSNKQVVNLESSPESLDDSSAQPSRTRTTRSRVSTLDKGAAATVKNLRSRKNSASSDQSELVEVELESTQKRVTRKNASAATSPKTNIRSRNVRAGSEAKSTPTKSKRVTRASSVDPASSLIETTGAPVKRRTRASMLPMQPTVTEEQEAKNKAYRSLENTVMEIDDDVSDSSTISYKEKSNKKSSKTTKGEDKDTSNIKEYNDSEKSTLDSSKKFEDMTDKSNVSNETIEASTIKSFTAHSINSTLESSVSGVKGNLKDSETNSKLPISSIHQNVVANSKELSSLSSQVELVNYKNSTMILQNSVCVDDENENVDVEELNESTITNECNVRVDSSECDNAKITKEHLKLDIKDPYVKLNRSNTVETFTERHEENEFNVINEKQLDSNNDNNLSQNSVIKNSKSVIVLINDCIKNNVTKHSRDTEKTLLQLQQADIKNSNHEDKLNSFNINNNDGKIIPVSIEDEMEMSVSISQNENETENLISMNQNDCEKKNTIMAHEMSETEISVNPNSDDTKTSISTNQNINEASSSVTNKNPLNDEINNSNSMNESNDKSEISFSLKENDQSENSIPVINVSDDEVEILNPVNSNYDESENLNSSNSNTKEIKNVVDKGNEIKNLASVSINYDKPENSVFKNENVNNEESIVITNDLDDETKIPISVNENCDKTENFVPMVEICKSTNTNDVVHHCLSKKQDNSEPKDLISLRQLNVEINKSIPINESSNNKATFSCTPNNEGNEFNESISVDQVDKEIKVSTSINEQNGKVVSTSSEKECNNEIEIEQKNSVTVTENISDGVLLEPMEIALNNSSESDTVETIDIPDESDSNSNQNEFIISEVDKNSLSCAVTDADGENASSPEKKEQIDEVDEEPKKSKKKQKQSKQKRKSETEDLELEDNAENLFQDIPAEEWTNNKSHNGSIQSQSLSEDDNELDGTDNDSSINKKNKSSSEKDVNQSLVQEVSDVSGQEPNESISKNVRKSLEKKRVSNQMSINDSESKEGSELEESDKTVIENNDVESEDDENKSPNKSCQSEDKSFKLHLSSSELNKNKSISDKLSSSNNSKPSNRVSLTNVTQKSAVEQSKENSLDEAMEVEIESDDEAETGKSDDNSVNKKRKSLNKSQVDHSVLKSEDASEKILTSFNNPKLSKSFSADKSLNHSSLKTVVEEQDKGDSSEGEINNDEKTNDKSLKKNRKSLTKYVDNEVAKTDHKKNLQSELDQSSKQMKNENFKEKLSDSLNDSNKSKQRLSGKMQLLDEISRKSLLKDQDSEKTLDDEMEVDESNKESPYKTNKQLGNSFTNKSFNKSVKETSPRKSINKSGTVSNIVTDDSSESDTENKVNNKNIKLDKSVNKSLNVSKKSLKLVNNTSVKSVSESTMKDSITENTDDLSKSVSKYSPKKSQKVSKDQDPLDFDESLQRSIELMKFANPIKHDVSTVAQVDSSSENDEEVPGFKFQVNDSGESDESDDENESESQEKSIDSDIAKEYNLAGENISKYSDDDVPGDDCRASEEESSDSEDDGADLEDFVVSDEEVGSENTDVDNEEEEEDQVSEVEVLSEAVNKKDKSQSNSSVKNKSANQSRLRYSQSSGSESDDEETATEVDNKKDMEEQSGNHSKLSKNKSINDSKSIKDKSINLSKSITDKSINSSKSIKNKNSNILVKYCSEESSSESDNEPDKEVEPVDQSKIDAKEKSSKLLKDKSANLSNAIKDKSDVNKSKATEDKSDKLNVYDFEISSCESDNEEVTPIDSKIDANEKNVNSKLLKNKSINHSKSIKDKSIHLSKSIKDKSVINKSESGKNKSVSILEVHDSESSSSTSDDEETKNDSKSKIPTIASPSSESESENGEDSYRIIAVKPTDTSQVQLVTAKNKMPTPLLKCSTPKPGATKKTDLSIDKHGLTIASNKSLSTRRKSGSLNDLTETKNISSQINVDELKSVLGNSKSHNTSVKLKNDVEIISSPGSLLKNRQTWKLIPLNQTVLPASDESPGTKLLKKSKLNDSFPVLESMKSGGLSNIEEPTRQISKRERRRSLQNKRSCQVIDVTKSQEIELSKPEEVPLTDKKSNKRKLQDMSNIADNSMLKSVMKNVKRARIEEFTIEGVGDNLHEESEEIQGAKKKKKKKNKIVKMDQEVEAEAETEIVEDVQRVKKNKKNKLKKGEDKNEVIEIVQSPEEKRKKKKKMRDLESEENIAEGWKNTEEKQKKRNKIEMVDEIDEVPQGVVEKKKKKKKAKELEAKDESVDNLPSSEEKQKKKKKKNSLNADEKSQDVQETPHTEVTKASNKRPRQSDKKSEQENLKTDATKFKQKSKKKNKIEDTTAASADENDAPESVGFKEAQQSTIFAAQQIAESLKAQKQARKKKQKELAINNMEPVKKTSLKRLSDDVLEDLTDEPMVSRPLKRQKLSRTTERLVMPSTSMFSPGKVAPANLEVEEDYLPLSSAGGTTEFGVVNLQKTRKALKKSTAAAAVNFRERMLSRNFRQPMSVYHMQLKKQKAKSGI